MDKKFYCLNTHDLYRKLTNDELKFSHSYYKDKNLKDSYDVFSDTEKKMPQYIPLRGVPGKSKPHKEEYLEVLTFSKVVSMHDFLYGVGLYYRTTEPKSIGEEEYINLIEEWQNDILLDTLKKFLLKAKRAYLDLAIKTITRSDDNSHQRS